MKVFPLKYLASPSPSFCMAPWVHTYLSPQTERRMCCASREPAQNFTQYIDTKSGTGKYDPQSLDDWWNGEHMRSVRRRMMNGETLPECDVCNNKLLNTDVYKDYFWNLFKDKFQNVAWMTGYDGSTALKPVSFDYRFSNLCNFKCRTCGDMLSSSWESEQKKHDQIDWSNPKNNWMKPDIREQISKYQDDQIEREFAKAVDESRVEEIYWVGGEPLMYEQHWRYMKQIVEQGDGAKVYARYNTNLSRIKYKGANLCDILSELRDWQICASIDGTGKIGEYIRTGLNWAEWQENFKQVKQITQHSRQLRVDFTLTLLGMFEVENMVKFAQENGVGILAKVIFSFSPDIIMSPLSLPRKLLDDWVDEIVPKTSGAVRDVLTQLKTRPTFAEQWPEEYQQGLAKGKHRMLQLEEIRNDSITIDEILKARPDVYEWWQSIES
jgi:hypothetical protein